MEIPRGNIVLNDPKLNKRAERRIYYRPNGQPTVPLRADGLFLSHYTSKGFTLEPPEISTNGDNHICPHCGFQAKSNFGLSSHLRKCNKEKNT